MGPAEMIAASALVVVLVLAIKVLSMQRQIHSLQNQIESLLARDMMNSSTREEFERNYSVNPSLASGASTMNLQLQTELTYLIREGQSIRAIKKLREATGLSLIEAKRMVDQLESQIKT